MNIFDLLHKVCYGGTLVHAESGKSQLLRHELRFGRNRSGLTSCVDRATEGVHRLPLAGRATADRARAVQNRVPAAREL